VKILLSAVIPNKSWRDSHSGGNESKKKKKKRSRENTKGVLFLDIISSISSELS
jgi:hypothetical protein